MDWGSLFSLDVPVGEIVVRGTIMYLGLFVLLRVILKRGTGSVGITDLLVLVLIADAAQNGMTGDYQSIPAGLLLVAVVIGWAWLLDALSYWFPAVERLVRPRPLPLIRDGRLIRENMRRESISMLELRSLLREQGVDDLAQVKLAQMETDGRISVMLREGAKKQPHATDAPVA
jgi:uncharacterized membrane protein YcaP (DUF421 family)